MPGGEFGTVSLQDYKGKYVVLLFYPADFTFVCPTELWAFSDRAAEFSELGCEVLAVSVDNKHSQQIVIVIELKRWRHFRRRGRRSRGCDCLGRNSSENTRETCTR